MKDETILSPSERQWLGKQAQTLLRKALDQLQPGQVARLALPKKVRWTFEKDGLDPDNYRAEYENRKVLVRVWLIVVHDELPAYRSASLQILQGDNIIVEYND